MLARIESGEATPMDLDILASVQTQIIGNCLCVLGDAMAMPIGSIVAKFRDELEAEIDAARERANAVPVDPIADLIAVGANSQPTPLPPNSAAFRTKQQPCQDLSRRSSR